MILVTGGNGFLGTHLITHLLELGKPVRALYRKDHPNIEGVEWVKGDVLDIHALIDAMDEVTEVYHCAAVVSFNPKSRDRMYKVNVEGTANVVNAALDTGVERFLHVSSIAALGRTTSNKPITEATEWEDSKYNSHYAISKHEAELEVWRGMSEGLQAAIVNPSVIIGPGQWDRGTARLFTRIWNGLKFYSEGLNGFVDVRDVVACMTGLMEQNIMGKRFIVSAQNLSYKTVLFEIAARLNRSRPSMNPPGWMRELLWRVEALRSMLFGAKPLITKETARIANHDSEYDSKAVQEVLNFKFREITDAIAYTSQRFLKEHLMKQA
jgi:nucleoside-diphosphate-sugar epimerase